jgi:SAM-dependent methyltransferase
MRFVLFRQNSSRYFAVNAIKADFSSIYRRRDPRDYYCTLGGLDYIIPEVAAPVLLQLVERLIEAKGRPITILDVGCSYGVLSAVMRHRLTMDQLRDRYASPSLRGLSSDHLAACDLHYFAGWPEREGLRFIGLDASPEAIAYARRVGLLADGLAVDLEAGSLDARAKALVAKADLIVSTGAVGYVTEKTFAKLLAACEPEAMPWVASFVLRAFDYGAISGALAQRGLLTERFESATFVQRRFRDQSEYQETLRLLCDAGVDPEGKEAEGLLHAQLFVSRPEAEVAAATLGEIVSLSRGGAARFRHRFRLTSRGGAGLAA